MDLNDLKYWAGTDETLAVLLAAVRMQLEGKAPDKPPVQAAVYPDSTPYDGDPVPRLLSKVGDIAIVKISGALNNTDHWTNQYYRMTGYPEIREALVYAATDESIGAVILDIHSGGGAVAGVFDTAKLIQKVDKIKPVHAFSDGQIASAAYLLGASARSVSITRMTEAGSVGVLSVHQEISKMLKEIGITPTVLRAGKYKALGNPYEPLSDAAQAEIQGQLDYMYRVFVEHVAERRKVSYEVADKKLAQGRVFIGDNAMEIGLVDAVTNFDDLASKLQGGIDAKKPQSKYAPNFKQGSLVPKQALTEQEIAALAVGGAETVAGGSAPEKDEAELTAEQIAAKAAADKEAADKAAADKEAADKAAAKTVEKTESEVVAFLRGEIVAKDERIVQLSVELRDEKAKVEGMQANHKAMRAIAEASVGYLRVALGTSGAETKTMDDTQLLAEQASLQEQFKTKFKAGGVASVTPTASEKKGPAESSSIRKARLEATRPQ